MDIVKIFLDAVWILDCTAVKNNVICYVLMEKKTKQICCEVVKKPKIYFSL